MTKTQQKCLCFFFFASGRLDTATAYCCSLQLVIKDPVDSHLLFLVQYFADIQSVSTFLVQISWLSKMQTVKQFIQLLPGPLNGFLL